MGPITQFPTYFSQFSPSSFLSSFCCVNGTLSLQVCINALSKHHIFISVFCCTILCIILWKYYHYNHVHMRSLCTTNTYMPVIKHGMQIFHMYLISIQSKKTPFVWNCLSQKFFLPHDILINLPTTWTKTIYLERPCAKSNNQGILKKLCHCG